MTDIPPDGEIFAIVPISYNDRPPSDAILAGRLPELMEYIRGTQARAAAEERTRLAQEQLKTDAKVLAQAQKQTVEAATRVTALGDAMVAARERQARKDAAAKKAEAEAAEARRIQTMLDRLPDPDDPDAVAPDDGDLQSPKRPTDKEHLNPTGEDGITGSFPTRLEKEAPRGGPYQEPDIKDLDYPQKPPNQPVAISLNEG